MKSITLIAAVLMSTILSAQKNTGSILYKESIKMDMDVQMEGMDPAMIEQIKAMMPDNHSFQNILYFDAKASLYTNYDSPVKEKEVRHEKHGNDMQVEMRMEAPTSTLYTNLKSGEVAHHTDLMGRQFLIQGTPEKKKWKVSTDIEIVQNYPCQKATLQDGEKPVEVWFTTKIPANVGPREYRDLPGAVLKVSIEDGKHMITAEKIDLGKVDKTKIVKPKKGKKVTHEEFEKIAEAKQKEMQEMYGGKGGIIIQTEERDR
ncbi:MAG: GLPGLI family protein [Aureispira sp.]|nr:GLPGLI family protein [Aureispira sp.]